MSVQASANSDPWPSSGGGCGSFQCGGGGGSGGGGWGGGGIQPRGGGGQCGGGCWKKKRAAVEKLIDKYHQYYVW